MCDETPGKGSVLDMEPPKPTGEFSGVTCICGSDIDAGAMDVMTT